MKHICISEYIQPIYVYHSGEYTLIFKKNNPYKNI
jgi:hypothetical protein